MSEISVQQLTEQSVNQASKQSANQTVSQSISQSIGQSINQSVSQSVHQSINQSLHQSIHQSINGGPSVIAWNPSVHTCRPSTCPQMLRFVSRQQLLVNSVLAHLYAWLLALACVPGLPLCTKATGTKINSVHFSCVSFHHWRLLLVDDVHESCTSACQLPKSIHRWPFLSTPSARSAPSPCTPSYKKMDGLTCHAGGSEQCSAPRRCCLRTHSSTEGGTSSAAGRCESSACLCAFCLTEILQATPCDGIASCTAFHSLVEHFHHPLHLMLDRLKSIMHTKQICWILMVCFWLVFLCSLTDRPAATVTSDL